MTKAKKSKKPSRSPGPPEPAEAVENALFELAGAKIEQVVASITVLSYACAGIRDELRGIREELARYGATNKELEAATGRLGQRIGEYIEHEFHTVR